MVMARPVLVFMPGVENKKGSWGFLPGGNSVLIVTPGWLIACFFGVWRRMENGKTSMVHS